MTETATTAAMYLRISSDPTGQKLGVDRQRKECLALCAAKGWKALEYVDNDVSAASGKTRPAYERMLDAIRAGRVGAVVAWDLDRLHRRPIELETFMSLADEHHLALATVAGDVDLAHPQGRLIARLKGNVAAHEIEQMRVRMRAAGKQRAESGKPKWRKAFGYMESASGPVPDPVTAPLVKQAYAALLAGASLNDLCRMFADAGHPVGLTGKPWSASTMSLFLRSPRNAGLREYGGEVIGEGTWAPLVAPETYRAVLAVMNAPERQPGRKSVRKHLLTGMMRCGKCGAALAGRWQMVPTGNAPGRPKAGETKPPKKREHRIAYACKGCRGVLIRAEHVEPIIRRLVAGTLAAPDAVDLIAGDHHDGAEAERLRTERAALAADLVNIGVERADGLLTGAQAKAATDRINQKIAAIDRQTADYEKLRIFDGIPLGTAQAEAAADALSPDRFRSIIDALMTITIAPAGRGHGRVFDAERVQVTWK